MSPKLNSDRRVYYSFNCHDESDCDLPSFVKETSSNAENRKRKKNNNNDNISEDIQVDK